MLPFADVKKYAPVVEINGFQPALSKLAQEGADTVHPVCMEQPFDFLLGAELQGALNDQVRVAFMIQSCHIVLLEIWVQASWDIGLNGRRFICHQGAVYGQTGVGETFRFYHQSVSISPFTIRSSRLGCNHENL